MCTLQKRFHEALRVDGDVAAIELLVQNPRRRFTRNEARRRLGSAVQVVDRARKLEAEAQAAERRANLYRSFRDLSARQQTKSGGFAGFVRRQLGERGWATAHNLLRSDLRRSRVSGAESTVRTARTNYRQVANQARAKADEAHRLVRAFARLAALVAQVR